jgi:hypothetical protein
MALSPQTQARLEKKHQEQIARERYEQAVRTPRPYAEVPLAPGLQPARCITISIVLASPAEPNGTIGRTINEGRDQLYSCHWCHELLYETGQKAPEAKSFTATAAPS